jgi:hypothetical protein
MDASSYVSYESTCDSHDSRICNLMKCHKCGKEGHTAKTCGVGYCFKCKQAHNRENCNHENDRMIIKDERLNVMKKLQEELDTYDQELRKK